MASKLPFLLFLNSALLLHYCISRCSADPRKQLIMVQQPSPAYPMSYHGGPLLAGNLTVHIIWYGDIPAVRRHTITDFILSLSPSSAAPSPPSVASWWATTAGYLGGRPTSVRLGRQSFHSVRSLGFSLDDADIAAISARRRGRGRSSVIVVVVTDENVTVTDFCFSRCGLHASVPRRRLTYAWVGDPSVQCLGFCAWPFHRPIYGPQTAPLVPPSGDAGADGMVITLATVIAGAVTDPYGNGFYQGPADEPVEVVSACAGLFGPGSFPGEPGELLVDRDTGASYNVNGVAGRKFLLPAMWDLKTSQCDTLV